MITLKTLSQASAQEVFDQVANHLLTQNEKSENELGSACKYKGHNNTTCAAGCLIADDEYDEKLELNSWATLVCLHLVPSYHHVLILELQSVHDIFEPINWKAKLIELAIKHKLNTNKI